MRNDVLDLLNRKTAEIERLQEQIGNFNKNYPYSIAVDNNCIVYATTLDGYYNYKVRVRNEIIKEFAERLKEKIDNGELYADNEDYCLTIDHVDSLVKEMVEEDGCNA